MGDYKCGLKFGLQAIIKSFDAKQTAEKPRYQLMYRIDTTNDELHSGNLYGLTSSIPSEYDYLTGEWRMSSMLHNGFNVWTKFDKYRRHLKLFLYDNGDSKRWIVGHNLS